MPEIDYNALAKQNGAITPSASSDVDYASLAAQHGAVASVAEDHPVARFFQNAWDNINPLPFVGRVVDAAGNRDKERALMRDMVAPHIDQAQKAAAAWKQGEHVEAFGHGLAAALPLVGPAAAAAGEKIGGAPAQFDKYGNVITAQQSPDLAGGVGAATGLIGGSLLPHAVGKVAKEIPVAAGRVRDVAVAKVQSAAPRPLSEGAIAIADKYNVPLTQGDLGGSKFVQRVQKVLAHSVAPDLFETHAAAAQEGLNAGVADLSGGFATDKFTAGQAVLDQLLKQSEDHAAGARKEYGALKEHEANPANQVDVVTGSKTVPGSGLLDASGNAITEARTVPVTERIGLPVDMRDVKQDLAPLEKEMSLRMTPAQHRADPGLTAIRNILARPDYLPASVAEADLGYLKDIARGDGPAQAKRMAAAAIESLGRAVQDGVSRAGEGALDSLKSARASWAARSQILDHVQDLSGDVTGKSGQVLTTNKLLQPSDASFPALSKVLNVAPGAAAPLGQAYLTERVFRSAADGSDFTTPKQATNLWNQIGPRTKAALYSPEQIRDVNDFLGLAQRVGENPNPSGTGAINTILKMAGAVTHPAGTIATFGMGRKAAQFLLNPERARLARVAIEGSGTAEGAKALTQLQALEQGKPAPEPEPQAQPLQQQQSGPEAEELGPDGPIFRNLKGQDAIDRLRERKTGDAIGAFRHQMFPSIDMIHGKGKLDLGVGEKPFGLAHIDEEHPGVADNLQPILDRMDTVKGQGDRQILMNAQTGERVVLAQSRRGKPKTWVVTSYGPGDRPFSGKIRDASGGQPAGETTPAPKGQSASIMAQSADTHNTVPEAGEIRNLDPQSIEADPVRFQFKRDTGGSAGVGDELKDLRAYDPELGGVLSVWHDPADAKTYVVNGHHRLELAKRAGAPEVTARYLNAKTANEARTKGALINMAEGRGTAIDAAKVMRDESITPEQLAEKGVSLKGTVARDGANLSKLSPELFGQVVSGDLPVQRASLIGDKLPNHADQAAALQMVNRAEAGGKKVSTDVFRELIDMVQGAPRKEAAASENMSLFGEAEPQQESTALEMAGLSDYVRKKLTTEKQLFGTVSNAGKSKLLEAAGNQLVGDKNGMLAEGAGQALAAYDKLKAFSGPVNDALRNAAASLGKRGAPANEIRAHAYERIRAELGKMLGDQTTLPPRP